MYYVATRNRRQPDKYTLHLKQLHFSKVVIQIIIRQHQETMGFFSKSYMLSLTEDKTLYGELSIIHIQHPHWITVNTSGTHYDPNYKGGTNHKYNEPIMDPTGNMLNHQFHNKQESCP